MDDGNKIGAVHGWIKKFLENALDYTVIGKTCSGNDEDVKYKWDSQQQCSSPSCSCPPQVYLSPEKTLYHHHSHLITILLCSWQPLGDLQKRKRTNLTPASPWENYPILIWLSSCSAHHNHLTIFKREKIWPQPRPGQNLALVCEALRSQVGIWSWSLALALAS